MPRRFEMLHRGAMRARARAAESHPAPHRGDIATRLSHFCCAGRCVLRAAHPQHEGQETGMHGRGPHREAVQADRAEQAPEPNADARINAHGNALKTKNSVPARTANGLKSASAFSSATAARGACSAACQRIT